MSQKGLETSITDFTHAVGLIVRRIRAAASTSDLSWGESSVLKRLATDGPATTAELARLQGMRPQSMRTVISSLEEAGMVTRRAHETDGRQMNIELTTKGAAAQKTSGDAKKTWLAQSFAKLSEQERETLFEAGRILKRMAQGGTQ
jgi:DNA-binding MarR family transcriptional regulator